MSEIFGFPKERVSKGDTFRCRKCRVYLFSFENLSLFHKKIEPVDQCSAWYINSDVIDSDDKDTLIWVKETIDKSQWTEGKLYCPKCTSRLGSFNFTQGVQCSCFAFVIPAIWIQKCKVDQISTCDLKPNIRIPEKPDSTDDGSSDTQGKGPMYYMETSQTGSQSGQSCSDRAPSGSQTSETGSQTCTKQTRRPYVQNDQIPLESLNKGDTQYPTDSKQTRCSNCFLSQQHPHEKSEQQSNDVHPYGSNSQKGTRNFLGNTMYANNSQKFGSGFNYKDKFGSCRIHRRRNKQLEMSTEMTEFQSQETCSTNENIEDLLDDQTDRLIEADGSRFELLKELEQGHELKEVTESTAHFKTEQLQEHQTHESEEIPEHVICPVCLDLLYEPLVCPCNHVFCDSCLRLLNSKSRYSVPKCPLCRKSLHYVYPAVGLREEIKMSYPRTYRERHKAERRAPHRRLPLPNGRIKHRQKRTNRFPDVPMPYSVLVVLGCVMACCVLCLVILFVFCPPARNRCITIMGYEWMNG